LNHTRYFNKNLQDMWAEYSSINAVNLVKKSAAILEIIIDFYSGITFLACPVDAGL